MEKHLSSVGNTDLPNSLQFGCFHSYAIKPTESWLPFSSTRRTVLLSLFDAET